MNVAVTGALLHFKVHSNFCTGLKLWFTPKLGLAGTKRAF